MPPRVFYPSCAVNLILRFDEELTGETVPAPRSAKDLAGSKVNVSIGVPEILSTTTALKGVDVTIGLPEILSVNGEPVGPPKQKAGLLDGVGKSGTYVVGIVPKQCSVEMPGYRQAWTFNMTFNFRDFPIDPRAVRALGVEIFAGTVTSQNFARGMGSERDNGRLASVLATNPDNLVMAGVADEIESSHTENGSEVTIEGRGLQGVFLDAKVAPESLQNLKLERPIHEVVAEILSRAPLGSGIPIEVDPAAEWPGGQIPAPGTRDGLTRVNLGADGGVPGMPVKGSAATLNFWDMIVQYCFLVGAVPYFEGHTLRIRPGRNLYKRLSGPTPFKGGAPRNIDTSAGPKPLKMRRMVYGRDLLSVKIKRKLGGVKTPTVRCVSVNTSSKQRGKEKLVEAEWPLEKKAKTHRVAPNGKESQEDVLTIPVPGVNSKERLQNIARDLYEEIARGEMGGSATSKALASFGGDNEDADLIRLRPGDPMVLSVDASGLRSFPPIVSELNNLTAENAEEAVRRIAARFGGDEKLARALVNTARGEVQRLQDIFHVSNVRLDWQILSGIGVAFDFNNYVESRQQPVVDVQEGEIQILSRTPKTPQERATEAISSAAHQVIDAFK